MINSRQADRLGVSAHSSFRRGPGLAQAASVADLTPLGCRLIDIPRNLARGEALTLRIGSVGPIPATVRWLKLGREAGIEFDTPLSEVAFNVLLGQHRLMPLDPFRAELMALHNTAIQPAEPIAWRVESGGDAGMAFDATDTAEPERPVEEKVVSIYARDPGAERRTSLRVAANDPAMVLGTGAEPVEVRIADFSHMGIRLGLANANVVPGSMVSIVFPDNEVVHGEVRWNSGEGLGIRVLGVGEEPIIGGNAQAGVEPAGAADVASEAEPDLARADAFEDLSDNATEAEIGYEDVAWANACCPAPEADFPPMPSSQTEPDDALAAAFVTELDCALQGLAALPDIPTDHLERFAALLEAAKVCEFAAISIRVTTEGIEMDLAYSP